MSMITFLTVVSDEEIRELHNSPERIDSLIDESHTSIDLDKAWHGIHWLLTGSAFGDDASFSYLAAGGKEVSLADFGYGPPRTITSVQVAEWDDTLSKISRDELAGRFDAKAMLAAEIYPQIWAEADSLDYLLQAYIRLKDFVAAAKRKQSGLLIYLS